MKTVKFGLAGLVNEISKALGGAAIAFDGVALVEVRDGRKEDLRPSTGVCWPS
jgi:hypothetical protein